MIGVENPMNDSLNSFTTYLPDRSEDTSEFVEFLAQFSNQLFPIRDFQTLLTTTLDTLSKIYTKHHIEIVFRHDAGKLIKFAWHRDKGRVDSGEELPTQHSLYHQVSNSHQIVLTNLYSAYCEQAQVDALGIPARSWIGLPIIVQEVSWGSLVVWCDMPDFNFQVNDKHFLSTISNIMAFQLKNIYLLDYIVERNGTDNGYHHFPGNKQNDAILRNAVHKLNNVFAILLGKTEVLRKKITLPHYREELGLLIHTIHDGATTVKELLHTTAPAKKSSPAERIDLNLLIREVMGSLQPRFENQAKSRGIHYDTHVDLDTIPPIKGNESDLREMLVNLITNALDAMPRGGTLSIQTKLNKNNILVFVKDTGIGIPFNLHEKIFEPEFTTKGQHGNGLGLSIVKEIIHRHHGEIFVDSAPHKGAVFMVEFPLEHLRYPENGNLSHPPQHSRKVLLVDHQGNLLDTLEEILKEEGWEATAAATAHDALLKLQKYDCDLVLTDFRMPDINGIDLAEKLKIIKPAIPIYLISGLNQLDPSLIHHSKWIDGILHRPLDLTKIRREILQKISKNGNSFHKNGK